MLWLLGLIVLLRPSGAASTGSGAGALAPAPKTTTQQDKTAQDIKTALDLGARVLDLFAKAGKAISGAGAEEER